MFILRPPKRPYKCVKVTQNSKINLITRLPKNTRVMSKKCRHKRDMFGLAVASLVITFIYFYEYTNDRIYQTERCVHEYRCT